MNICFVVIIKIIIIKNHGVLSNDPLGENYRGRSYDGKKFGFIEKYKWKSTYEHVRLRLSHIFS
jgi:hypothetical protein